MAKFTVSSVKVTAKGNIVASLTLPADGRVKGRSSIAKLFRAFVDNTVKVGEELDLATSDFVESSFEGTNGEVVTIQWYDPS